MSILDSMFLLWFVVSVITYVLYGHSLRSRVLELGEAAPLLRSWIPGYLETVYVRCQRRRGRPSRALWWSLFVIGNVVASTVTLVTVVVPAVELAHPFRADPSIRPRAY